MKAGLNDCTQINGEIVTMDRKLLLLIMIVFFLLTLVSCSGSSGGSQNNPAEGMQVATLSRKPAVVTPLPTRASDPGAPTVVPTPGTDLGPFILMLDDFSDPESGWEVSESEYGRAAYEQGGYVVEAYQDGEYYWGVAYVDYSDIRIDVEVTVLQTPENLNDTFGVDCRIQENGDGYGFRISSDGMAAIMVYVDTQSNPLVDWFKTDAVFTDGSVNTLTAVCQGTHLDFLVNGINVAEAVDDTFYTGDIALSAASYEAEPVKVLFDNLVIQEVGNPYEYEDLNSGS